MLKRSLGTCYYPEHWPEDIWADDARRMVEAGLTWVRIGEFCWSRIEPEEGKTDWGWLDRAIEVLGSAGLKVVLGTPTATPPRWVADKYPDMFAVDVQGRPRGFGSRRHYCFSHAGYFEESRRIATEFAARYGRNPHVAAWQTDNEYGCHDTVISYSEHAKIAFQDWCAARYETPEALNAAWGNVFWSMEYNRFDQIELPNLTVTEPNPAHVQAFYRFSSDQVVAYNRMQVEVIKAHSDAPISHNYMGKITDFDHYKTGDDLEIATWDSYPLGFLEDRVGASVERQKAYARQGDPDFQAFHHDLYRAVGKGRWWVMEQQPGPVNWAPYNPAPLPGMVRLWSWEAFAHGAEAVCYFRWRQAPMAQEQLHAGMLRPDSVDAQAIIEAREVAAEMRDAPEVQPVQAPVGLVFDYDADWAWRVQPQGQGAGQGLSYFDLVFDHYKALRKLGLSVDILRPETRDFTGYQLLVVPGAMHLQEGLSEAIAQSGIPTLYGPRSGARDLDFKIPLPLPPAVSGLDLTVTHLETLRPDGAVPLTGAGEIQFYREHLDGDGEVLLACEDGTPVVIQQGAAIYNSAWLDQVGLRALFEQLCAKIDLKTQLMPEGVRRRITGSEEFWFNYSAHEVETQAGVLPAAGVIRLNRA